MSEQFAPRVGGILSADIAVPEHARVVGFYSHVLTTGENPLWREDLMNKLGMPIIGLGPRTEDCANLPIQWMPHIQVADVARSVERALALGGSELIHGKSDDGTSLWAVLRDPNGAAFGIIPVPSPEDLRSEYGSASYDDATRVGCIGWLDLTISDASTTRDFYREVVGWSAQDVEMEDGGECYADYNMLAEDGNAAAGICHARGVNGDQPPIWMIYLPVGDLTESLRRVQEGEGEIIKTTQGDDGECSCAVVQDPVGACLSLVPG